MRARCRASCAMTRLHYRLVTNSECTRRARPSRQTKATQHFSRNVATPFSRLESVRQPIELSLHRHPRIQRRIGHWLRSDRDGAAIGDAVLTLWFRFRRAASEKRVAVPLPTGAADPLVSAPSLQRNIMIICSSYACELRMRNQTPQAPSRGLVGRPIAIGLESNSGTAICVTVNSCVAIETIPRLYGPFIAVRLKIGWRWATVYAAMRNG
jgi:hypothetical protein